MSLPIYTVLMAYMHGIVLGNSNVTSQQEGPRIKSNLAFPCGVSIRGQYVSSWFPNMVVISNAPAVAFKC